MRVIPSMPIWNINALDKESQSLQMTIVEGGYFAVDTFLFMSGLLATRSLLKSLESGKLKMSFGSYLYLLFARYVRLTPIYVFVLFFYIKAFSYFGSGPYWRVSTDREMIEEFCKNSWTNPLYINNLYPFDEEGGVNSCMVGLEDPAIVIATVERLTDFTRDGHGIWQLIFSCF